MKTPHEVIREALLKPVPCPKCGKETTCRCLTALVDRADARAQLVVVALTEHGLLVEQNPAAGITVDQVAEVAQYLAKASRFVRYADDGWEMLTTSERDVEVAYAKAREASDGAERAVLDALARARDLLVQHIEARRASDGGA